MTFEHAQLSEDDDNVLIAILDETYFDGAPEENWEARRDAFRQTVEAESGLSFTDADIGPGASLPAFATVIAALALPASATFAVLIAGKPIKEGVDGWLELAGTLRKLFQRQVYLNRNGASALAIEAIVKEHRKLTRSITLIGYQPQHVMDPDDLAALDPLTEIADAPGTIYLGALRHIFEFDVDGHIYRVSVEGRTVKTLRVA